MSQACKPKRRLPRMTVLAVISLMLLVAIWFVRPEQLQVVLYKISLVTIGGVLGYWVDYAIVYGESLRLTSTVRCCSTPMMVLPGATRLPSQGLATRLPWIVSSGFRRPRRDTGGCSGMGTWRLRPLGSTGLFNVIPLPWWQLMG